MNSTSGPGQDRSSSTPPVTPDDVEAAATRIAADVVRTPTRHSRTLSAVTGAEVFVKFENLQFTGSFKDRGAANHICSLGPEERERGVIALSAGNHAQGVAHIASRLGIEVTIVMPATAPFNKVVNTRALGAQVVQHGATLADARERLQELGREGGLHRVPPYDDAAVVAGQGTVALEMLADAPDLDVIVVPVGGGGLVAGVAVAARALRPAIEIIGVQCEAYAPVAQVFDRRLGRGPSPGTGGAATETLADGIAVKSPGRLTTAIIDDLVDDVVTVPEVEIERAIGLHLEIEKTVAEGAGAASLAAVTGDPARFAGRRVGLVLSGGNIDSRMLASVLMRRLVRTDRISTLRVRVGDVPGQLAPIVTAVAGAGANIIEVDHRPLFDPISARTTTVDFVVETRDAAHRAEVVASIETVGCPVEVLA